MLITNALSYPRYAAVLFGLLLTLCAAEVAAGSLDAPAVPTAAGSAMHTLTDLYNRLNAGTTGVPRPGAFVEPVAGPTAGTGYTLNQIMGKMPTLDNANGAVAADVLAGKTFWGLTGGAWGLQTGTLTGGGVPTGTAALAPFPAAKTGDATENSNNPKGATWPSPRFADNGNGTVTDNLTGLVWLKDANCAGVRIWDDAMSWAATLATGRPCSTTLSDGSVVGQWRLPNIKELSSLVDAGASSSPVLSSGHPFTGAQPSSYWSSTESVPLANNQVWYMDLTSGTVGTSPKTIPWRVWPVRGGLAPPAPVAPIITSAATRFTDNSNGTVTDSITGLIWLKDLNCSTASLKNWATALTAVATLASGACSLTDGSTAGQWRLPSRNELQSLIDYSTSSPALPSGHPFTGVQIGLYWSSTTHADNVSNAWFVSLDTGNLFITSKIAPFYVWPVRGGL